MDRMAERAKRGFEEGFAPCRVRVDGPRHILESRAHLDREAEAAAQFRYAVAHPLNADDEVILGSRNHADEACLLAHRQGTSARLKREDADLRLDDGFLGLLGGKASRDDLGIGEANRRNAKLVPGAL